MSEPRLGLRANAGQFALLVALNAVVGALVGLERSILPLVGEEEFGVRSQAAILAFIVAFGAAKALSNLISGGLAERHGRRRVLLAGWVLALPAALLIGIAPSWAAIVAGNVFLGASQGLAWSMTVVMKIDLVGPKRRGLALGLNESAGYVGVALTAAASGALAASIGPRTVVWVGAAALASLGLVASALFVRETEGHVLLEADTVRDAGAGRLWTLSQAGFFNNLNDALVWGLVPLYLADHGASAAEIGAVAGTYPAVWGLGQLATGALSDRFGRRRFVVWGMLVQGAALLLLLASPGNLSVAIAAAAVLGAGTALVYPTLLAAVSDAVRPAQRARAVARYRFWRDAGLVAGALLAGAGADVVGDGATVGLVAALTAASGLWLLAERPLNLTPLERRPVGS
jgi:MFS family permease